MLREKGTPAETGEGPHWLSKVCPDHVVTRSYDPVLYYHVRLWDIWLFKAGRYLDQLWWHPLPVCCNKQTYVSFPLIAQQATYT